MRVSRTIHRIQCLIAVACSGVIGGIVQAQTLTAYGTSRGFTLATYCVGISERE